MSFSSTYGLSNNFFWTSIGLQFGIAVACLFAACWIVPHCWQLRADGRRSIGWKQRIDNWILGSAPVRARRRARLLALNPICWLSCRDRFSPLLPMAFAILSLALALGAILYYDIPVEPSFGIIFGVLAINDLWMRARVAAIAGIRLGNDRQSGALEMVLSTPLTVEEIMRGQWMAIRRKLLWTYIPLLLLYSIVAFIFVQMIGESPVVPAFFILLSIGDFIAMGYVGMWNGMRLRKVQQVPGRSLLRVVTLPWFAWFTALPFLIEIVQLIQGFAGYLISIGPLVFFMVALTLWIFSFVTAVRGARRNLLNHFREAATDRYLFEKRIGFLPWLRRSFPTFCQFFTINLLRSRRSPVLP
jgi:hypothetical protein